MRPGTYPIYKNSAAAQITLILPKYNDKEYVERAGGIFIEAAPATGKDAEDNVVYDWTAKISVSLGANDIASLFDNFERPLVHQWKGSTKNLSFKAGEGKYEGTYMLQLREKTEDGTEKKVIVPVSAGEAKYFARLVDHAATAILGW